MLFPRVFGLVFGVLEKRGMNFRKKQYRRDIIHHRIETKNQAILQKKTEVKAGVLVLTAADIRGNFLCCWGAENRGRL